MLQLKLHRGVNSKVPVTGRPSRAPLLVDVGDQRGLYHLGRALFCRLINIPPGAFTALSSGRQSSRRTGVSPMRRER